jgi:hypothetical protein
MRLIQCRIERLNNAADIIADMVRQDFANGLIVPEKLPIEKIREAKIDMNRKPKAVLLKIRAAISGMSMELTNHYHARKYNWALARAINNDLGYDAIRIYGSTVYFTAKFRKEIGG